MSDLIVARAQGLELRPAVDFSADEAACLDGLEYAVIIQVSQPRIETEPTARKPKLFAAMHVRRDASLHLLQFAGAQPQEVAFGESELCGDVAHENVEQTVAVHVAEIHAHALERIAAKHARL